MRAGSAPWRPASRRSMLTSLKAMPGVPHGEPGPQAPARRVLVADHQPIGHSTPHRSRSTAAGGAAIVIRLRAADNGSAYPAARAPLLFHEPAHASKRKDDHGLRRGGRSGAGRQPDSKSVPIWLARDAGWAREAPLSDMQKAWVEAQGFKGTGKQAPAAARRRRRARGRGAAARRGARRRSHGQAGAGARALAGVLPPGLYHLAERRRRCRAGRGRLGPRRLPLPALQVGDGNGERGGAAEAARRAPTTSARWRPSTACGWAATSSTRRRATWGRRSWRRPPASWPSGTAPTSPASSATTCDARISR